MWIELLANTSKIAKLFRKKKIKHILVNGHAVRIVCRRNITSNQTNEIKNESKNEQVIENPNSNKMEKNETKKNRTTSTKEVSTKRTTIKDYEEKDNQILIEKGTEVEIVKFLNKREAQIKFQEKLLVIPRSVRFFF